MKHDIPIADAKSQPRTGLMAGKRGLIMGVANDHSIAWGIARMLASHGAEIAFTYQGDAQAKRLRPLAAYVLPLMRPGADDRSIAADHGELVASSMASSCGLSVSLPHIMFECPARAGPTCGPPP